MKQILCFGDSNTWGYDGESRKRLPWGKRWTSLLQEKFDVETAKQGIQAGNNTADQREAGNAEHKSGESVRIIEEGLCGRTTIFEDPLRDGRRGTALLPTLLETHDGVDVIVLMLGTNDCKTVFGFRRSDRQRHRPPSGSDRSLRSGSEGTSHFPHLSGRKSMAGRI